MSCKWNILPIIFQGISFEFPCISFSWYILSLWNIHFILSYFHDSVLIYCYIAIILDTPRKREESGVSFFNHFRKDFICPYGLVHNQTVFDPASRRLNNINCEFHLRPQIAISEFTETVPANLQYVEETLEILDKESISAFIRKTKKIEPYLKLLDSIKRDETGICITLYLHIIIIYIKIIWVT